MLYTAERANYMTINNANLTLLIDSNQDFGSIISSNLD